MLGNPLPQRADRLGMQALLEEASPDVAPRRAALPPVRLRLLEIRNRVAIALGLKIPFPQREAHFEIGRVIPGPLLEYLDLEFELPRLVQPGLVDHRGIGRIRLEPGPDRAALSRELLHADV